MKIGYRLTASAMLVAFAVYFATDMLFPYQPLRGVIPSRSDTSSFDPCALWAQGGLVAGFSGLAWFVALVAVTVGGLRNRPLARWVAILCLIAFAVWAWHSFLFWRWQHCASTASLVTGANLVWLGLGDVSSPSLSAAHPLSSPHGLLTIRAKKRACRKSTRFAMRKCLKNCRGATLPGSGTMRIGVTV
jgi:uncharacterized membrane protein YhaH (DUF805 family)